jgi:hypothetical protein
MKLSVPELKAEMVKVDRFYPPLASPSLCSGSLSFNEEYMLLLLEI